MVPVNILMEREKGERERKRDSRTGLATLSRQRVTVIAACSGVCRWARVAVEKVPLCVPVGANERMGSTDGLASNSSLLLTGGVTSLPLQSQSSDQQKGEGHLETRETQ